MISAPIPSRMQLRATPESRRVATLTAICAAAIAVFAAFMAVSAMRMAWIWWVGFGTAIATMLPAVNAITARVEADDHSVTVRSFGRTRTFEWSTIAGVRVIERRASVPDGTEYHWFTMRRSPHLVAVPCLELVDGRVRELPMLASRASADGPRIADENAHSLVKSRP